MVDVPVASISVHYYQTTSDSVDDSLKVDVSHRRDTAGLSVQIMNIQDTAVSDGRFNLSKIGYRNVHIRIQKCLKLNQIEQNMVVCHRPVSASVCLCARTPVCVCLHQSDWRKTKWCRNAGQRKRELQDWGMGQFVDEKRGVLEEVTDSDGAQKLSFALVWRLGPSLDADYCFGYALPSPRAKDMACDAFQT